LTGAATDSAGHAVNGWTEELVLRELVPALVSPLHQSNAGRNKLNADGYIEVEFPDMFGVGLDEASLQDAGHEIELYQLDGTDEVPVEGVTGIQGVAEKVSNTVWRYRFSGRFDPGQVYVRFLPGTWQDKAGNLGAETVKTFNVYSNAASFEIMISGSAELYAAIESLKLMSVSGSAKLSVDMNETGQAERVQLDLNGRADMMFLGTIGAVSGRFVFAGGSSSSPGLWGVMKLDTNFENCAPSDLTSMCMGSFKSIQPM
jgi:hypothetical protein